MDALVNAIAQRDFVKVKSLFKENMAIHAEKAVEARRIAVAESVMIEGESKEDDDDNEDDDDDDEDESDSKDKGKNKKDD